MIRWRTIFLPILVAAICWNGVGVKFWDDSKQALLVCLSVIAAGVLVRLARPFPFTTVDQYDVQEIRDITTAVLQISRSLRALLTIVLTGMIGLVIAKPITDLSAIYFSKEIASAYVEPSFSAALGLLMSYVLLRMWQVVRSDQNLTELQSKFVVRAVERKQAERFEKTLKPVLATTPLSEYGKPLQ